MKFKVLKQSKNTLARTGVIETKHGRIQTPFFMPCATVGSVKGVSPQELSALGYEIILANTYHLHLRPGEKAVKKMGGLHNWMKWPKAILTDSGGYQVFSLGKNFIDFNEKTAKKSLVKVTAKGVEFRSHLDGSKHFFRAEKVIDIQKNLGSDILMVLDECTEFPATHERAEKSMETTHQWAKEALKYKSNDLTSGQAIFGIIQGSTYKDLRMKSAKFITSLPFDGIAVGGVAIAAMAKKETYKVMRWMGPVLPKNKPHYLMGVGDPEDIIEAVKWGFDMFDCVLPTRLGRHGTVWVTKNWKKFPKIDLRRAKFNKDKNIIMAGCKCPACAQGFSRAYVSHLIKEKEMLGMRLASLHNLWVINELMRKLRKSI